MAVMIGRKGAAPERKKRPGMTGALWRMRGQASRKARTYVAAVQLKLEARP
jgi:hypothetical protein